MQKQAAKQAAKSPSPHSLSQKWKSRIIAASILVAVAIVFVIAAVLLRQPIAKYNASYSDAANVFETHVGLAMDSTRILFEEGAVAKGYAYDGVDEQTYSYEHAVVTAVLSDSTYQDETTENVNIGLQELTIRITTGKYKGQEMDVDNNIGKLFDKKAQVGTRLLVRILTDGSNLTEDGTPTISVAIFNYNRVWILALILLVFLVVTVLVGGKVGLRSILGLLFTLLCIFLILVPALLRGFYAIPFTLMLCVIVTIVCFILLDGINRKTLSAMVGTIAGFTVACLFAMLVSKLAHIDGLDYNTSETDTLVQAKYQGTLINIRGLFVSGIIISTLGAVMDVAMSISSSINELKTVNPAISFKQMFRSGMNIGRDAVGTMTNTLILAFTGSALVNLILIQMNNWNWKAIISNDYITAEIITGVAGSIGLILAVPLSALVASLFCQRSDRHEILAPIQPVRKQKAQ